ncbi:MAG: DUF2442 domain-containing protein [Pseudomonadota bacterium]|nr:DUF2442 domain-containing protein [Pseudomonadota bacterium]
MFLHVTEAKYLHDYLVEVTFNNGRRGYADLSEALHGPVFEPLKDVALFSRLRVDKDLQTITWENGVDLAPEYIYFQAFKSDAELAFQFREWGYLQ